MNSKDLQENVTIKMQNVKVATSFRLAGKCKTQNVKCKM